MNYIKSNLAAIIGIIVFFSLLFNILNYYYRDELLKKSYSTIGIMIKDYSKGKNGSGTFEFLIKSKKHYFREIKDFSHLKRGDTVLIEYAIEDPSVARVKDSYYMHKFQRLKKQ